MPRCRGTPACRARLGASASSWSLLAHPRPRPACQLTRAAALISASCPALLSPAPPRVLCAPFSAPPFLCPAFSLPRLLAVLSVSPRIAAHPLPFAFACLCSILAVLPQDCCPLCSASSALRCAVPRWSSIVPLRVCAGEFRGVPGATIDGCRGSSTSASSDFSPWNSMSRFVVLGVPYL